MTLAITLEEILDWNDEVSGFWKAHLDANPALLALPCSIDDSGSVQVFVRHIWGAELRWSQRIACLPVTNREDLPAGPLDALFDLHMKAMEIFRTLIANPAQNWEDIITMDYAWLPLKNRSASSRKLALHALVHGQRHWAQLATLLRAAEFPSEFMGDMIFSAAIA
jgi:uncharacterized damage-inducible protein DinB